MLLPIILFLFFGAVWSENDVAIPKLNESEWWGPDELIGNVDTSIRRFQVEFSDAMIEDLICRLNTTIYSQSLIGVGFTYGFHTDKLLPWIKYWSKEYPFSEREDFLNQFPQYKTNIQGLDIHFLWVKPNVTNGLKVVPLLLLHGWPGSVREFYEAIPALTSTSTGYNFTFEVIVPSLPGFGFSDGTLKPGLAPPQIAVILKLLMQRLGHDYFYLQGGDFGAIIGSNLATLYPENVLGHHTNFPFILNLDILLKLLAGQFLPDAVVDPEFASRLYPLKSLFEYYLEKSGYFHIQATRPDSIGIALSDSPAGLLAYIIEKMTKFDYEVLPSSKAVSGEPGISKEKLIDNLMMYWCTNSIMTSMRLYSEYSTKKNFIELGLDSISTVVPIWYLQTKNEIFYLSPQLLKNKYPNFLGVTVMDYGGHFIAFEYPREFSDDIYKGVSIIMEWREHNCFLNLR